MNQSSFKCFATFKTHPLLKLKRSVVLVMYSAYSAFSYYTYKWLIRPYLGLTGDAFCYLGHAHVAYRRQGQSSILLVMYSAYTAFCYFING